MAALLLLTIGGFMGGALDVSPRPSPPPAEPKIFVAYGDSFTRAGEPGVGDQPHLSWAAGTEDTVESLLVRLRERVGDVAGFNGAITGSRMETLPRQVASTPPGADYVVILLGINDTCWPGAPTPPETFQDHARVGFDAVKDAHPDAHVVIYAIPDLLRLADLHAKEAAAQELRAGIEYCRPFWDPARDPIVRAQAGARWAAMNEALRVEALAHGFSYSDATAWPGYEPDDLNALDFFHPNRQGQARMAGAAWQALASLA